MSKPLPKSLLRRPIDHTFTGPGWFLHTSGHHALLTPHDGDLKTAKVVPAEDTMVANVAMWRSVLTAPGDLQSLLPLVAPPPCATCSGKRRSTCRTCHGSGERMRDCDHCGDHPHMCVCDDCDEGVQWCQCTQARPLHVLGRSYFNAWLVHDAVEHMKVDPMLPFGAALHSEPKEPETCALIMRQGDRIGLVMAMRVGDHDRAAAAWWPVHGASG